MAILRALIIYARDAEGMAKELVGAVRSISFEATLVDPSLLLPVGSELELVKDVDLIIVLITKGMLRETSNMRIASAAAGYVEKRQLRPLMVAVILDPVDDPELDFFKWNVPSIYATHPNRELAMERIVSSLTFLKGKQEGDAQNRVESQERVERQADAFLNPIIDQLNKEKGVLADRATLMYGIALISLSAGLLFALARAYTAHSSPPRNWTELAQTSIVSLLVIGTLTAVARFAFVLGRSFMIESLTNSDRAHAISFGRFFLQAYGERMEVGDIRGMFDKWNIDRGSSFVSQAASDVDPVILQAALKIAESAVSSKAKSA